MQTLAKLDSLLLRLSPNTPLPSVPPRIHLSAPSPLECAYRHLDTLITLVTDVPPCSTLRAFADAKNRNITSSCLARVTDDYYEQSFEQRQHQLNTASTSQLCKSIIVENTAFPQDQQETETFARFYLLIVQYVAQMQSHKLFKFLRTINPQVPKKYFHFRVADESEALVLAGFEHNAITPFGMKQHIPIILANDITELPGDFCWIGGGEIDVKLGFNVKEFVAKVKPMVTDLYKRDTDEPDN